MGIIISCCCDDGKLTILTTRVTCALNGVDIDRTADNRKRKVRAGLFVLATLRFWLRTASTTRRSGKGTARKNGREHSRPSRSQALARPGVYPVSVSCGRSSVTQASDLAIQVVRYHGENVCYSNKIPAEPLNVGRLDHKKANRTNTDEMCFLYSYKNACTQQSCCSAIALSTTQRIEIGSVKYSKLSVSGMRSIVFEPL